jgi:fumarate reductase subunit D
MSRSRRSAEPYLWMLFGGGGVVAALVLPVLVLLLGVLIPLGLVDAPSFAAISGLAGNPLVRLALLVVVVLCLFHAAHRIRFTAEEMLRIARWDRLVAILCYGLALAGTAAAAAILLAL